MSKDPHPVKDKHEQEVTEIKLTDAKGKDHIIKVYNCKWCGKILKQKEK